HKLAGATVKSSEWELKSTQLEIATQVKQVYHQLGYLYAKQKLFLWQDSLYGGFLRAAELRLKTGETNRLEMITARSQGMEVRNQLKQLNADILIFNQKLGVLINSSASVLAADTMLSRISFLPPTDSMIVATNPTLEFMQQQSEISKVETNLERSRMLPDLSIGYFSQTMQGEQEINGVPRTFGKGDRFSGIQAGISIPLWFAPYTAKIKAAKQKSQQAQINAENYSKTLAGNYQSLIGEYSKYASNLDYYEKQAVPEADLIIDQATKSYRAGAIDYLDYIQSLSRALTIKLNYLDALNNYNQTIISIDYITGRL
ncbi:MAG TPA: TolC family protein, partial [Paludibacter sp.]